MVKKEGWVIDIPEEEYELREKISRIQISDEPIKGMGNYHETENAYFKSLKEGFHYEWRCVGGYFKTFEEAKKHLKEKEGKKYEFETIIEELKIDTTIHQELIQEVASVYDGYAGRYDKDIAKYLTIAYMVRRLSVKDLPLNKERRAKSKEVK